MRAAGRELGTRAHVATSRLYELQHVDSAIAAAIAQRAALNDGTAERAAVAAAADRLSAIRGELAAHRARARDLELAIQSVQDKRARVERDLYSGRIGNPKELTAMQEEATLLARTKSRAEDDMLGILDAVERLEPQEHEGAAAVEAAEAALTRQVSAFEQASAAIETAIGELNARRAALAAELDEDLLRRYDRLRDRKGGVAIVAVREGICEGCHMTIPERVVRRLEEDPEALGACDGCGRWLYIERRR